MRRNFSIGGLREYLTQEITPDFSIVSPGKAPLLQTFKENSEFFNVTAATDAALSSDEVARGRSSLLRKLLPGSQRACVLTFVATALGSSVFALPFAISHVGIMLGALVLAFAALMSALSLSVLMLASRYTEAQTFAALLTCATGSSNVGLLMDMVTLCYGVPVILALLILEGDFLPAVLDWVPLSAMHPTPSREICIIATAVCAWPTVMPSNVSALRYVAAFSPFAILLIAGVIVGEAPHFCSITAALDLTGEQHSIRIWHFTPREFLQAISIFVFSVMCHANAVPVAHMLDRPSAARIVKVAWQAMLIVLGLYLIIGTAGYLSFRGTVQGDLLRNYPVSNVWIQVCRALLIVVCFVGIPMNATTGVKAGRNLLTAVATGGKQREAPESPLQHAVLATVLLAVSTVGAIRFQNVATVLGLLGGSLATLQMFWLPAVVYRQVLWPTQPKVFRMVVLCCLIFMGSLGFASLFTSIL